MLSILLSKYWVLPELIMKNKIFFVLSIFVFVFFLLAKSSRAQSLNLSENARNAINNLAKKILTQGYNSKITNIKSQLDPGDYATVKNIRILPINPLYVFKYSWDEVRIFFTFDKIEKSHLFLRIGNERTLETLLTLEKATKENNPILKAFYINISAGILDSVGSNFDYVSKNIDSLDKDEAVKFAGVYLKHQILLQQEEDSLSEKDFLKIESVRVKHLPSLAHIVISNNKNPETIGQELAQVVSPQVGLNYKNLVGAAILRDLENNAEPSDQTALMAAQKFLIKDWELKLSKLSKKDRLAQVTRYTSFIHGNPIRQFQAYNQIATSFNSEEMQNLTLSLKDRAAQNFKRHLNNLGNPTIQKQFVQTVFSEYPIDLRILFYTQIQLENPKVLAVATPQDIKQQNETQLTNLNQIKTILESQVCQNFGNNVEKLAGTRFYTASIKNPDILDVKIGQFLFQSIQSCSSKSNKTLQLVTNLQKTINNNFAKEAKTTPVFGNLPSKLQAEEILKEEGITSIAPQDEQIVAEVIEEEIKQIEDEAAPTETIIEEVVAIEEPTQEEVIQKEEEIVEEIIDAAETGETSPLVEELPAEVQEEVTTEAEAAADATPTLAPTLTSTPIPTIVPTIEPEPTATPTVEPLPTEEPTLIETVESTAPSPTPMEVAPSL